jgi:hypothetical protein
MGPKKREISYDDENDPASNNNKRVKTEPKEDEDASDDDSEATVVTDEQRLVKLVLSDFENDEEAAVKALNEIANLCYYSNDEEKAKAQKNQEAAFTLGLPAALLKSLNKYQQSSRVQEAGLRALANIVRDQEKTMETVAKLGGIERALSAMARFPSSKSVQRNGCLLLGNLASLQSLSARIADHPDTIPSIVAAMKKFPNEAELQQWGCMALGNVSEFKVQAHINKIVEAEGLVVLAQAKTKHPNNDLLQEYARDAIKNLND